MPPLLTQMKRVFFQTSVQLMCSGRMLNGCCTQPQPHITCHVIGAPSDSRDSTSRNRPRIGRAGGAPHRVRRAADARIVVITDGAARASHVCFGLNLQAPFRPAALPSPRTLVLVSPGHRTHGRASAEEVHGMAQTPATSVEDVIAPSGRSRALPESSCRSCSSPNGDSTNKAPQSRVTGRATGGAGELALLNLLLPFKCALLLRLVGPLPGL